MWHVSPEGRTQAALQTPVAGQETHVGCSALPGPEWLARVVGASDASVTHVLALDGVCGG